ncbi:hypothetical protein [Pontibacter vulgaris]|uniref:hypothetical protein n=1 Tax=Pontibacter vulgaris TaxID=2905679 RepID=UPI001FA7EB2A|nr:hypothetical protein [Pontibacter vulgaris]
MKENKPEDKQAKTSKTMSSDVGRTGKQESSTPAQPKAQQNSGGKSSQALEDEEAEKGHS